RDPAGANRADVTPTAAQIVAAIPDVAVGSSFEFLIVNTADAAETITVTAGTGVTLVGTMTIAQNASRRFTAIVTAVDTPAVSIYACPGGIHMDAPTISRNLLSGASALNTAGAVALN